jgi:cobalt-zinc-cadmium efflux system membrane fusion protein
MSACSDHSSEGHDEHGEESHAEEHGGHEGESHEEGVVELGPEMLARLMIRTAATSVRVLPAELLTTGMVDFEQDRLAHVTPRIPGRVEAVEADLGDEIRKGQVLAVINSIELGQAKSDYLQATAHEEVSRQNFEREEGLFAERISSEKEMLVARAAHLEAIARLRNAEETLRLYGLSNQQIETLNYEDGQASLLPVRSPLSGRVVEKHVTIGELVTPERNMFTIADLGHVWIWIDVYEQDLRNVHLEDDVAVAADAYPDELFGGKVSYLSDQVDAGTRTVRARIDVDNPEHKLRPGMFVRVTLSDPHSDSTDLKPSLVVPVGAVQRDGEEFIVFVTLGNGRFARHEVTVGRTAGEFTEILSGLDPTDTVVVEGAFILKSEASKEGMGGGHAH